MYKEREDKFSFIMKTDRQGSRSNRNKITDVRTLWYR